mgnify:CR=1 FL=1
MPTLEKLKLLLGIVDENQDVLLQFVLDDVMETILAYCNIEELPQGLEMTAYRMAMDLYRNENLGAEESAPGSISSLTEGDTSTSFNSYVSEGYKDTLLKSYEKVLNRYRRVVFR